MDIEKLKEARHIAGYTTISKLTEMDWTVLREISKDLIDEAIARQSVTSEKVAEAIEQLKYAREQDREFDDGTFVDSLDLAITALQAYQPKGD